LGNLGGVMRRSGPALGLDPIRPIPFLFDLCFSKCCDHSSENLNENARYADVAGGVSLSELDFFECIGGLVRAKAVSRRASSKVRVGLSVRLVLDANASGSVPAVKFAGSILPMKVQRFLPGVLDPSEVSFGSPSTVSTLVSRDDWRLKAVGPRAADAAISPSNPRKILATGAWLSFRMMRRRRPGAGKQGKVDGGRVRVFSACCF
jgi:hypothetical protein